jgi:predicted alpha/beta-hydrolase family hydrolase
MKKITTYIMKNRKLMGTAGALATSLLFSSAAVLADDHVISLDITNSRAIANCATVPMTTIEQSYLLVDAPDPNTAAGVLLLFVGGGGKLDVANSQLKVTSTNFLLRSRHLFAAKGFHVALMDAASDFLTCNGGLANRRTSGKYTLDMASVIIDLHERFPGLPLWVIGTSRGTTAAAQAAAYIGQGIDGLVLTSPMTNPVTSSVFDVPLANITVPTMITAHEKDTCFVTPPEGMESIKDALVSAPKIKTADFDGGFPALSANPCDATTPHGYLGVESEVVEKITNWIMKVQFGE